MDEKIFEKYIHQIKKRNTIKKELQDYINKKTNTHIKENQISIAKNVVSLHVSSAVKQKLHQNNIQHLLKEKGFTLKG